MNLGERMKRIRLKKGITLLEIANKLNKTEATIQRYESGNIKNLKSDTIEMLANSLGVEPAYLMGWIPEDEEIMTSSKYIHLPTAISAGLPLNVEAITEADNISIPDSIMGKWAGQNDIVIANITGESMNKTIPNGSLIAIKPMSLANLKDGDIVVFSDEYEYSVKRMYQQDEHIVFRPHSTDIRFTDYIVDKNSNLKIHGKVNEYLSGALKMAWAET